MIRLTKKSVWIDKDGTTHYMPLLWTPTTNYGNDWIFEGYAVIQERI